MASSTTSMETRVARLEGATEHLATKGDLYKALWLQTGAIIASQIGIALLVVRALS